jgi:transposase
MPKALSDDLRSRIMEAYARKEGSWAQLANRFGVSFEFDRKLRKQFRQTGQMKRRPRSRRNALSRMTAAVREQSRSGLREQPDRTLISQFALKPKRT